MGSRYMNKQYSWNILHNEAPNSINSVVDILLANRDIKTKEEKEEFFNPTHPNELSLKELKIDEKESQKAVKRLQKAIENKEHIVVYGDYDADGVCATAILWQTLYKYTKTVTPFLPDRFVDGYGLHAEAIEKLKAKDEKLSLIVTVDNGIVANDAVKSANDLGIDVIVTDHHQVGKKLPKAHAIVHTDLICGSGVAWIVSRELDKSLTANSQSTSDLLDLAAIGTISDQMPLVDLNRSFVKHGLGTLNKTKRCGLLALFENANVQPGTIGTYEVNFLIAPRINAMGRLESAMDSLRLMCTTNTKRAQDLSRTLGKINLERQKMVEEMVLHAKTEAAKREWLGAIVLAHETYHEGVIGLIASKLVEEFYRPAIVLSRKDGISKASARSIHGFNIIENIRKLDHLLSGGGGHPMAAGFSIETTKIGEFALEMETISKEILTDDLLQRTLLVDTELPFSVISDKLLVNLADFNPVGIGNPTPLFVTKGVHIEKASLIGTNKNHIKMSLSQNDEVFEAIAFNFGEVFPTLSPKDPIDIIYSPEMNHWNGKSTIQLKVKDIKYGK